MSNLILVVEDDPLQRHVTCSLLIKKLNYAVKDVASGREAIDFLGSESSTVAAVLLDISMPEMDGFDVLRHIKTHHANIPVLMLTAQADLNIAVQAIKEGASDFITKPPDPAKLEIALKNAIKISSLTREVARLKKSSRDTQGFSDLIGCNNGLSEAVAFGRKAAATDLPVLLTGETGTGKELFARAIHSESRRSSAPFIVINCGAIPENLTESVLFGHEKGAFTGATMRTLGKFREADGGTIFLDEIGELPLAMQVKLLRVLQEKEVEPVGAAHSVKVNVRVISATNRDLKAEVKAEHFREDLYFRLNVLPINMPSLRKRLKDIIPLAEHFMQQFSLTDNLPLRHLTEGAKNYLISCSWPGNVRELQNLIHNAMVFFDGTTISEENLSEIHTSDDIAIERPEQDGLVLSLYKDSGGFKSLDTIEFEAMQMAVRHFDGNIAAAAEALNIAKSTFYRRVKTQKGSEINSDP